MASSLRSRCFASVISASCFFVAPALAVDDKPDTLQTIAVESRVIDRSAHIVRSYVGDEFFARHLQFRELQLKDLRGVITMYRARPAKVTVPSVPRPDGQEQLQVFPEKSYEVQYEARPEVYYEVVWEIRFSDRPPEVVVFDVDLEGRLLTNPDRLHLPRCVKDPDACNFKITSRQAGEIASRVIGLPDQLASPDFCYSEDWGRFVWAVKLGLKGELVRVPCPDCRMAIIDAVTGEVLFTGRWSLRGGGWN